MKPLEIREKLQNKHNIPTKLLISAAYCSRVANVALTLCLTILHVSISVTLHRHSYTPVHPSSSETSGVTWGSTLHGHVSMISIVRVGYTSISGLLSRQTE